MTADYDVELRCRECGAFVKVEVRGVPETLVEVALQEWEFKCPEHGEQKARPFTVRAARR